MPSQAAAWTVQPLRTGAPGRFGRLVALLGVLLCLLTTASSALSQDERLALWGRTAKECKPQLPAVSCIAVDVNVAAFTADTPRLSVMLPNGKLLLLSRQRSVLTPQGFVWNGRPLGGKYGTATFSVVKKAIVGEIVSSDGKIFRLRFADSGSYVVEQVDSSKLAIEEPVVPPPQPSEAAPQRCMTDSPRRVDVMVFYTPASIGVNHDEDHMQARVYQGVEDANWAFEDSGVDMRIRAVRVAKLDYANESLSLASTLDILTEKTDVGINDSVTLNSVHTLRETFNADLVALIVHKVDSSGQPMKGGRAVTMNHSLYGAGFESKAFAVVLEAGLGPVGDYFFAHELAHLMGSNHDVTRTSDSPDGAFDYSHGYAKANPTSCTNGWRTIMAQNAVCIGGCGFIPRWSNPRVIYCGDPMGIGATADNARSLDAARHVVANFRCGSPQPNNVWMKDTWDDLGLEPDPAQAGADMWRSPYIWVRNAQDTQLQHEYEHQDPRFGQTNWAYVKVHNSGPTASGSLELYRADASTSISWPTRWTLISSQAISAFAANSTRIVEFRWDNLPQPGHHCLLARWNSTSDPMTNAEGTDVDTNVRATTTSSGATSPSSILQPWHPPPRSSSIGDADDPEASFDIEVRAPLNLEGRSFLRFGTIAVKLDKVLQKSERRRSGSRESRPAAEP